MILIRTKAAGLLAAGWVAWFWTWTSRVMLSSLIPGIMGDLSLGPAEGSTIAAAINAGWAACTFTLGLAGSLVGAAITAIGSLALSGLVLTSLSSQHSYLAIIVLFTTPFYPVVYAAMYETFEDATSAALGSAMSVGNLVGSSLIIPVMMCLDTGVVPSAGLWLVPVLVASGLVSLVMSRGALNLR